MNTSIAQVAPQDLIPVFQANIGGVLTNACDARLLHVFLEVGRDFTTWIKARIKQYGFAENLDYITITKTGDGYSTDKNGRLIDSKGQVIPVEYTLTLDMGKELSMVEKNDKGRQARKYFINCERLAIEALTKPQYGLKSLPPSPYISEAESLSLRRHIEAFCKGDQKLYKAMYNKLYKGYNIAKYDQLPAGKLNEALVFLGLNNIQLSPQTELPEQSIIVMSKAELLAHDEKVASEAVKRVQGELVEETSNTLVIRIGKDMAVKNLSLVFDTDDQTYNRWFVQQDGQLVFIKPMPDNELPLTFEQWIKYATQERGYVVIQKSKLEVTTMKQISSLIA